jgi:hypothetical protein
VGTKIIPVLIFSMMVIYSCKKEPQRPDYITTVPVSGITQTTAITGGNFGWYGLVTYSTGVCYNTIGSPALVENTGIIGNRKDSVTIDGFGEENFVSTITGLTPSTTYYVVAYARGNAWNSYGKVLSFTTLATKR